MQVDRKVRTCFWFSKRGIDAANHYVSLLPDSRIDAVYEHGQPDDPMVVEFTLGGAPMMILTAGPQFSPSEAASISVLTEDQEETDRLWSALIADGGAEGQCGWLKDKYGISWQIVPKRMVELFSDDDTQSAGRAMQAMMTMRKIDIAAIENAFQAA